VGKTAICSKKLFILVLCQLRSTSVFSRGLSFLAPEGRNMCSPGREPWEICPPPTIPRVPPPSAAERGGENALPGLSPWATHIPPLRGSRGRAVKFSENACHCEESATKPSPETDEIASQSLATTLPFRENLTALGSRGGGAFFR
jgi:hypothetical protein